MLEQMSQITSTMSVMLSAIAAISLLVGFVIMLAVMFIFKVAGGKNAPASTVQDNN